MTWSMSPVLLREHFVVVTAAGTNQNTRTLSGCMNHIVKEAKVLSFLHQGVETLIAQVPFRISPRESRRQGWGCWNFPEGSPDP